MNKELEKQREQKCSHIMELCEQKKVDIVDDYFTDIFCVEGTKKEIFRAMSSRGFNQRPELIDETLDGIIAELEAYQPKRTNQRKK